jgi:hypothetical protein
LVSRDIQTDAYGFFSAKFTLCWEEICDHPGASHIAFGDEIEEHDMLIVTELLPPITAPSPPQSPVSPNSSPSTSPTATSKLFIPLTHSPLRVISDIDDTIKFSNILSGARAVFKNVFVKELTDITIPGMGEWYSDMWRRGVRFHYVVGQSPLKQVYNLCS